MPRSTAPLLPASSLDPSALSPTDLTPPLTVRSNPYALAAWNDYLPRLQQIHFLTPTDIPALSSLAICKGILAAATETLNDHIATYASQKRKTKNTRRKSALSPLTVIGAYGVQVKHPVIAIINQQQDALLKMEKEFGLTPASRARMTKKAAASAPTAFTPANINPLRNPDKHAGFEQYKGGLAMMKLKNNKKAEEDDDD